METEFKKGDLVKHKSQQSITMVIAYFERDEICCRYYNTTTGLFTSISFNPEELVKV